tara:strand:+ start:2216 stop:2419 length:204 start_codon:yes stop_codon:yes gene_type:complete
MDLENIEDFEYQAGDLKLLIDFDMTEIEFKGKPLAIESIKYKNNKINKKLKQSEVNLKNKPKGKSLF